MTTNYYRIQGAPTNSIVTAVRTGSTVSLTATAEALMFLNLPIETEFIMNPRSKRQFRKISDFADAFIIDLEALPDYVPPTDDAPFSDIPEPADDELVSPLDPTNDDGIATTEPFSEAEAEAALDSIDQTNSLDYDEDWAPIVDEPVDDLSEIAFGDELDPADDEPSILDPVPTPHTPTVELADDDDEPRLPDMTSLELRKFGKAETIRLGRTADILGTGWIVKGKLRHGAAKHWLPKPIFLENALVTKIGNKWIFFKVDGAEYFATETEGMVYRSQ